MTPFFSAENILEAGCDEAGRGCLAGPVVAAAVILPPGFDFSILNDSKKLTALKREKAAVVIKNKAVCWAVGVVDHEEIDQINILKASIKAIHLALDQLTKRPDFILVDGNKFYAYPQIKHQCIVDGDALYASIAAASIIAKTHRDELMQELHLQYPHYKWNENKGYSTPAHKKLITEIGVSPLHRRSFAPVMEALQLQLDLL
jgi:ribonuclease HII